MLWVGVYLDLRKQDNISLLHWFLLQGPELHHILPIYILFDFSVHVTVAMNFVPVYSTGSKLLQPPVPVAKSRRCIAVITLAVPKCIPRVHTLRLTVAFTRARNPSIVRGMGVTGRSGAQMSSPGTIAVTRGKNPSSVDSVTRPFRVLII